MNIVTWIFLGAMVGITAYLWNRRYAISLPNLVVTMGVLGTFVGIFWGLYNFDVGDIQGSIPALLEGLKFAFITSIFGMIMAIGIRLYPLVFPAVARRSGGDSRATLDTVAALLRADAEVRKSHYQKSDDLQQQIHQALADDGALSRRLRSLGDGLLAKQDELLAGFSEFAEKVAEKNNEVLIESLTEVMREFNTKINVQFGENFRQLNVAVEKLVAWQEQYSGQLEEMTAQFARTQEGVAACQASIGEIAAYLDRIRQGVGTSENAFKTLVDRSDRFQRNVEELNRALVSLYNYTSHLANHLYSFSQFADRAKDVMPLVQEHSRKAGQGGR